MNFQRNIRVRNEQAYWSPLPRQFNLNRLTLAGELQGLQVPPQRNLQFTPYVLGEALHRTETSRNLGTGDVGADFKYSVTPSLTLDLTYNTDFAQVEVDDQQINLDRFNLFFPRNGRSSSRTPGCSRSGSPGAVDIFFSRIGSAWGRTASRFRSSGVVVCRASSERTRTSGFSTCRRSRWAEPGHRCRTSRWDASVKICETGPTSARCSSTDRPTATWPATGTTTARSPFDGRWGHRRGWHRLRLRRPDRHARDAIRRDARVCPERAASVRASPAQPRLHRGGPQLQPRGGVPGPPELPTDERQRLHDLPAGELHGRARAPPARQPLHASSTTRPGDTRRSSPISTTTSSGATATRSTPG